MGNAATKERLHASSESSALHPLSPEESSRRSSLISNGRSSRRTRNNSVPSSSPGSTNSTRKSKGKGKNRNEEEVQNLVLDLSEMVDGGYLQPQGVYTGPQDFTYKVVRELIIERKLAPFYKGLSDYNSDWTDRQLLAAVRGLPLPVDRPESSVASPVPELEPIFQQDPEVPTVTNELNGLRITGIDIAAPRKPAMASVFGENSMWGGEGSSPASSNSAIGPEMAPSSAPSSAPALTKINSFASTVTFPDVVGPTSSSPPLSSSPAIPFPSIDRPLNNVSESPTIHVKTAHTPKESTSTLGKSSSNVAINTSSSFGSLPPSQLQVQYSRNRANTSSRYGPSSLPNRVPQEILLYRDAMECPICFLFYPKLINLTRCCAQPICTECFVQIKRPDPHPPHEEQQDPNAPPEVVPEKLISEAACCPYCMVPELGVTFVPPPYRTGIGANAKRHNSLSPLALFNSSAISLSSKNSASHIGTPMLHSDDSVAVLSESSSSVSLVNQETKRRGSLPASAPEVVTTDQIRPDWNLKLATARARAARRAAAATALHASAFLSTTDSGSSANRSRENVSRHRPRRFSRLRASSRTTPSTSSVVQSSPNASAPSAPSSTPASASSAAAPASSGTEPSARQVPRSMVDISGGRLQELEDMMFLEAVRLSMKEEEERKLKGKSKASDDETHENNSADSE